jgi:hypothetical protein
MKTRQLLCSLLALTLLFTACSKDSLAENEKNIKKSWKLEKYFIDGVDKTSTLYVTGYDESYTDQNRKYDRSFTDGNGNRRTQSGSWEFENANRVKISGVGSIEMSPAGTVSSSYYDLIRLTDAELWYSFVNGGSRHELRLSRK